MAAENVKTPLVPVSWGEVFDKLTILRIKEERIEELEKLVHIRREKAYLEEAVKELVNFSTQAKKLVQDLQGVNEQLWDIEDKIRDHERQKLFDSGFIELARKVYMTNDKRSALKKQLNLLLGSELVEEKSYQPYT